MGSGSSSDPPPSAVVVKPARSQNTHQFEEVQLNSSEPQNLFIESAPSVQKKTSSNGHSGGGSKKGGQKVANGTSNNRKNSHQMSSYEKRGYSGTSGTPAAATPTAAPAKKRSSNAKEKWQKAGKTIRMEQEVVNQMSQKQQELSDEMMAKAIQLQELQQYQGVPSQDVMEFETFYHDNGRSYTCIVENGQRMYLDSWDSLEWKPFPRDWHNQGRIVQDGQDNFGDGSGGEAAGGGGAYLATQNSVVSDDRGGTIRHPTRGTLLTYIFEEKRNIHCYFDDSLGVWIKMPVSWEQHTDFVKPLVSQVQDTCEEWKDKYDVIASLRQSNYDIDDCVTTRFQVGDSSIMESPDRVVGLSSNMAKKNDDKIRQLTAQMEQMKSQLKEATDIGFKLKAENQKLNKENADLEEKVATLESENRNLEIRMLSMHERPKTARPKTARPPTPEIETEPEPEPEPQGPTVDEESLLAANNCAKQLDKAHHALRQTVTKNFADMGTMLREAIQLVSKVKEAESGTSAELEDLRIMYRKECMQRKILYNKLQELRGNIRVFCRVRKDARVSCAPEFPAEGEIACVNPAAGNKKQGFEFDKVFNPDSTQEQVFDEAKPIIASCVDGYNVCLMAYGQTGSGKTFTMMGPKDLPGVNIRSIKELLKICSERDSFKYTLMVSLLEVYNEHIQDLLVDTTSNLEVKMNGKKLVVPGLTEVEVKTVADIQQVMATGDKNRTTASTKMNSSSSRSHLLLILQVEGVNKVSNSISRGSLTLVDLAGSERIAKTGATGQLLVEAAAINKSLTSLGQVFSSLRTNALHVPYRNSKLTHLLQPSLGGDAKACLFVNVSPDVNNISETISTLQFGSNARQVQLGQATKNVTKAK